MDQAQFFNQDSEQNDEKQIPMGLRILSLRVK